MSNPFYDWLRSRRAKPAMTQNPVRFPLEIREIANGYNVVYTVPSKMPSGGVVPAPPPRQVTRFFANLDGLADWLRTANKPYEGTRNPADRARAGL